MGGRVARIRASLSDESGLDELPEYWYGSIFYGFGLLYMTHLALGAEPGSRLIGFAWFIVALGAIMAAGYLILTRFWKRWLIWKPAPERPIRVRLAELVIVVVTFGSLFAALNSVFVAVGWIRV